MEEKIEEIDSRLWLVNPLTQICYMRVSDFAKLLHLEYKDVLDYFKTTPQAYNYTAYCNADGAFARDTFSAIGQEMYVNYVGIISYLRNYNLLNDDLENALQQSYNESRHNSSLD